MLQLAINLFLFNLRHIFFLFFFIQLPKCMQETVLRDALKLANKSSIEEAIMHSQLIESQLVYLEQLGELPDDGSTLYDKAKQVRDRLCSSSSCVNLLFHQSLPSVKDLLLHYQNELKNLKKVFEVRISISLQTIQQLDSYDKLFSYAYCSQVSVVSNTIHEY